MSLNGFMLVLLVEKAKRRRKRSSIVDLVMKTVEVD